MHTGVKIVATLPGGRACQQVWTVNALPGRSYNDRMLLLYLFLLFTVIPVVELSLLWYLGWEVLGWPLTISLVLLTGFLGVTIARLQGMKALLRVHRRISRGQLPADELFDGMLVLFAGILLVTPGVLTDVFGFLLLIPPVRQLVKWRLRRWAARQPEVHATQTTTHIWTHLPGPYDRGHRDARGGRDQIIDAEVIDTRHVD